MHYVVIMNTPVILNECCLIDEKYNSVQKYICTLVPWQYSKNVHQRARAHFWMLGEKREARSSSCKLTKHKMRHAKNIDQLKICRPLHLVSFSFNNNDNMETFSRLVVQKLISFHSLGQLYYTYRCSAKEDLIS